MMNSSNEKVRSLLKSCNCIQQAVLTLLIVATSVSTPVHATELLQNSNARKSIDLNGDWQVIVDPYDNGYYTHRFTERQDGYFVNAKAKNPSDLVEYDFARSQTLTVPGDWNSQDRALFFYEGTLWYQKDFDVQKQDKKRYLLHFGAVNYQADVYVNGAKVGSHEGGFTAFEFDVSEHLRNGNNFVVVRVSNRRERDNVPTVNTDWWNYGGITRPVKLIELESRYIADYFVQLTPGDAESISGWLRIGGDIAGAPSGDGRVLIEELGINEPVAIDASGFGQFTIKANPELWSPQHPRLYDVELVYGEQSVADRIGFRTIAVRGEDILLNGKSVYLRGISIHEEAPSREGRAWSEQDARTTLSWARELGCNFVRLAHYPHNEAIVRMADEMGLMVWSEIPVYWTIQFDRPYVLQKAENQLTEMISRDKNRAAVVLWSVANETPNNEDRFKFLSQLVDKAKEIDPSRLVTAALDTQNSVAGGRRIDDPFAAKVDVIGINSYCGWYGGIPNECAQLAWESIYNKPVIVSEFGAGALQGYHGSPQQRWTEEYQASVYEHNLTMLQNMSFVRGTTPWILKDFRSPRRPLPGIQDFWNRKGLLSETGERKQAWYLLRDFYAQKAGQP